MARINQRFVWTLIFMIISCSVSLYGNIVTESGVRYQVDGKYAKVLGASSKDVSTITIQAIIEGAKVNEIVEGAFQDCQNLINVTIQSFESPELKCRKRAFYNCKNLKKVTINGYYRKPVVLEESVFEGCSELEKIDGIMNIVLGRRCLGQAEIPVYLLKLKI